MTISVKVPKDISAIKKKLLFNLTKRQIISFFLAGAVGVPVYIFTKEYIPTDMAALVMVVVMMPFLFVGIYEKDGYPAEKIIYFMIRRMFLLPGIRPYRAENFYQRIGEDTRQEKTRRKKKQSKKAENRPKTVSVKNKQKGDGKPIAEKKK
uniref:PrgI family protein n=1 Tax=Agathobacter sp. TaxID=2021311 RepID=UPI0040560788